LKSHDYSKPGYYFVTLCTYNRELYFEKFPLLKEIVDKEWHTIPNRFENVMLDEYIVMPNHVHGIIIVGATLVVALKDNCDSGVKKPEKSDGELRWQKGLLINRTEALKDRVGTLKDRAGTSPAPTTFGGIIGSFKSLCSHAWLAYIRENNINA